MLPIGMHISDVVVWLKEEHGLDAPLHRVRYALKMGSLPDAYRTASGDFGWRERDLPDIADYFRSPKKPGRPKGDKNAS